MLCIQIICLAFLVFAAGCSGQIRLSESKSNMRRICITWSVVWHQLCYIFGNWQGGVICKGPWGKNKMCTSITWNMVPSLLAFGAFLKSWGHCLLSVLNPAWVCGPWNFVSKCVGQTLLLCFSCYCYYCYLSWLLSFRILVKNMLRLNKVCDTFS